VSESSRSLPDQPSLRFLKAEAHRRLSAQELAEHFEQPFLDRPAVGQLIESLSIMARTGRLRDEVTVITQRARFIGARAGDVRIETAGADEPPHRLRGMMPYRVGKTVTDTRVAAPPADAAGDVPEAAAAVAEEALGEFGLPGLVLAGADDDGKPWVLARGWTRKSRSARPAGSRSTRSAR
jgi:hypothetical protein